MLQTILLDTRPQPLHTIEHYLDNSLATTMVKKFELTTDALRYCAANNVEMIVCNIAMVEKETIECFKDVRPTLLIVCAGHREDIEKKNIEENVFGYLYRPFSFEAFWTMFNKACMHAGFQSNGSLQPQRQFVFIKSEYKTIRVDFDDILYCESLKDYTQIHLKGKLRPLITLQNLKALSAKLPAQTFVRVHKSFTVAVDKIDAIARNGITIGSNEIPVGEAYRDQLQRAIGLFS